MNAHFITKWWPVRENRLEKWLVISNSHIYFSVPEKKTIITEMRVRDHMSFAPKHIRNEWSWRRALQSKANIVIHCHIVLRFLWDYLVGGQLTNRISQNCIKPHWQLASYKRTLDDNYTNNLTRNTRLLSLYIPPSPFFFLRSDGWRRVGEQWYQIKSFSSVVIPRRLNRVRRWIRNFFY